MGKILHDSLIGSSSGQNEAWRVSYEGLYFPSLPWRQPWIIVPKE